MKGRVGGGLLLLMLAVSLGAQYKPWYSYDNYAFGVKALGMGNAFTAVADDPTAAFWNPAGLAELRVPTLYLSYRTNQIDYRTDPEQRTRNGITETYDYDLEAHLRHLDFFAVTVPARVWDLEWTFGVSYYPYLLYGFEGSSTGTLTSSAPGVAAESTVVNMDGANGNDVLAFSAAFCIPRVMAVGATLQQFFNTGSSRARCEKEGTVSDETYDERLSGRNLILGVLFTPVERVRLGFTYHAGLKNKLSSRYSRLVSTETTTTTAS
ncbi:MAG TPA: outer membrane protein transport protein, partial [Candidatus Aminicenantes bacterium]|nr:outer membrane protein transport protein [Candidatus Aminicenantes bacterium]